MPCVRLGLDLVTPGYGLGLDLVTPGLGLGFDLATNFLLLQSKEAQLLYYDRYWSGS